MSHGLRTDALFEAVDGMDLGAVNPAAGRQ
jgi:hypothetical protein